VAELTPEEVDTALSRGLRYARKLQSQGLIIAATLGLNGEVLALEVARSAGRVKQYA
jgi:hypothetical protein